MGGGRRRVCAGSLWGDSGEPQIPPSQSPFSPAAPVPTPWEDEAGVPSHAPIAPGITHMAKRHGFCPAYETHLTQNLLQRLQRSLAAPAASLGLPAPPTQRERRGGGTVNNGALWKPPKDPQAQGALRQLSS